MPLLDVLAAIPWDSKPVTLLVEQVVRGVTGVPTDPAKERLRRMEELLDRQEEALRRYQQSPSPAAPPAGPVGQAAKPAVLAGVVDRITLASGNCKEALRFAREDGMAHPEVQVRLADAQAALDELERHDLRPEVLVAMSPDERRAVEVLLPEIRRARQGLHNAPDGGPPTVESLTDAAAKLGELGTQARVLEVSVRSGLPVPDRAVGQERPVPETSSAYSRYAPDMSVDTGCLPCGRAHVAGADAILRAAVGEARVRGMADPDVQARVQSAAEELAMVYEHDWTPERIARSPEADRAILEEYAPRFKAVRERLAGARTPDDLAALSADLARTRQDFMLADQSRGGRTYTALRPGGMAAASGAHRLDLRPWVVPYGAVQPGAEEAALETAPPDPTSAYDNLVRALHAARGVRVVYRETPRGEGGIVEAEYDPEANTILMAPFALSKDFYAVQTLAHEAAHALTVNPVCAPEGLDRASAEEVAENTALAAMVESALPIELRNGQVLEPGERRVDWGALQASLPQEEFAQVRWATDWIVSAIGGQDPGTLPAGCAIPIGTVEEA